ncbi:hypothetical protein Pcinc_012379 [Petrolisthes cinctipes]|uniref:Uncharacterized protein n=1 Tax=Petrolisthes cinctipes TaxID=88211 RepID=A0AAE1KTN9_PETCI|nr:hypothetical protein Pcinc_012379 [Petrolisthes cinctipes]
MLEEVEKEFVDYKADEITTMEVDYAIKKMKNGKAPGVDEIPVEILKGHSSEAVTELGVFPLVPLLLPTNPAVAYK